MQAISGATLERLFDTGAMLRIPESPHFDWTRPAFVYDADRAFEGSSIVKSAESSSCYLYSHEQLSVQSRTNVSNMMCVDQEGR